MCIIPSSDVLQATALVIIKISIHIYVWLKCATELNRRNKNNYYINKKQSKQHLIFLKIEFFEKIIMGTLTQYIIRNWRFGLTILRAIHKMQLQNKLL